MHCEPQKLNKKILNFKCRYTLCHWYMNEIEVRDFLVLSWCKVDRHTSGIRHHSFSLLYLKLKYLKSDETPLLTMTHFHVGKSL